MAYISYHPCFQDPPLLIRVPGEEKERALGTRLPPHSSDQKKRSKHRNEIVNFLTQGAGGTQPPLKWATAFQLTLCSPLHSYTKSAVSFEMYFQQFTLCYCLRQKTSSSYSLIKFVYVTSQLRHPLVVRPLLRKLILDPPPGNHGEREHFTHAPLIG